MKKLQKFDLENNMPNPETKYFIKYFTKKALNGGCLCIPFQITSPGQSFYCI